MKSSTEGCTFASKKAMVSEEHWMTFFTSTYQREKTLGRLYESILKLRLPISSVGGGKVIDYEWIIVDDGSTDGTAEKVKIWCEEDKIPIRYYFQENQGKHVACNFAVNHCKSEMFMSIDSDDALLPNALETFYEEWESIPDKKNYKGVSGRCIDPDTNKIIGSPLPQTHFDTTPQDLRLKYKVKGEMGGFNRTAVMKEYPFISPDPQMRFCPENIVWYEMGKKYKERDVDIPVRKYYRDTSNAITNKSTNRSRSNYYLWRYGVNNLLGYWRYSPKEVLRQIVGISMDGFKTGRSVGKILNDVNSAEGKILVLFFMPIGWILSKKR